MVKKDEGQERRKQEGIERTSATAVYRSHQNNRGKRASVIPSVQKNLFAHFLHIAAWLTFAALYQLRVDGDPGGRLGRGEMVQRMKACCSRMLREALIVRFYR